MTFPQTRPSYLRLWDGIRFAVSAWKGDHRGISSKLECTWHSFTHLCRKTHLSVLARCQVSVRTCEAPDRVQEIQMCPGPAGASPRGWIWRGHCALRLVGDVMGALCRRPRRPSWRSWDAKLGLIACVSSGRHNKLP